MAELLGASSANVPVKGPRRLVAGTTSWRRLLADRAARWVITAGGLAIVASILGILLFIFAEVAPLLRPARVEELPALPLDGPLPAALVSDEYRSRPVVLSADGHLRVRDGESGRPLADIDLATNTLAPGEPVVDVRGATLRPMLGAATGSGRVLAVPVSWDVSFEGDVRQVDARPGDVVAFDLETARAPEAFDVALDDDGTGSAVAVDGGRLVVVTRGVKTNMLTDETVESFERSVTPLDASPTLLLLSPDRRNLYGALEDGALLWWRLDGTEVSAPQRYAPGGARVTALTLLVGGDALVVGRGDGALELAFGVRGDGGSFQLRRIRGFAPMGSAVTRLAPSPRDKGFLAQDATGDLALYHSTSARRLWRSSSPAAPSAALRLTPRADGAFLVQSGQLGRLGIDNPHPEISLHALLGRVWYEGYEEPAYVWQSSAATDSAEPKLSLVPLMFGTLKGTLYSLVLAIPLGVLGAMYTSQFMHPRLKRFVKPAVEIMAALPSVVLGFLAGLWLAPRIEYVLPGLMLMPVVLPLFVLAAGAGWRALPGAWRNRTVAGSETLLYLVVLALGMALCTALNAPFGKAAFGGSFQHWLLETTGLPYDQRNAVVVGLAMGFAVIPIIFSIAEDAFSNVPRNLVSGSLALGANRWQTVTRVVLPTASPGIFSAIMIGFGRAVGETMIVLMATGNTPILDWNPFNGFRTLSANIAVEIPEAPQGGTLYRTLFLAALILFVFTFVINTAAELVRQRLRARYAQM